MSNPVFGRINKDLDKGYASFGGQQPQYGQYAAPPAASSERLEDLYRQPSAGPVQTGRLTVDDVIMKFAGLFALVLVTAGATAVLLPLRTTASLVLPAIVVTLVLGLVIAFKKSISVPLIVAYALFEGVLVGAVSRIYNIQFAGQNVVATAVVATLSVFVGMFIAWKTGMIRVNDKFRRFMTLAVFGYAIFAVANLVAAWVFSANSGWGFFAFGSPISIGISMLAVGLASFSLVMDFDSIDRAVKMGVPEKTSWLLAHGLIVTVVWLYLEMLRLIAQISSLSRN